MDMRAIESVNSLISWLGVHPSPLCACSNSWPQLLSPNFYVKELVIKAYILCAPERHGIMSHYLLIPKGDRTVSVMDPSDAGCYCYNGQLWFIPKTLGGYFKKEAVLHTMAWKSHNSAWPVCSMEAANILV